jgi:hypothetical protein
MTACGSIETTGLDEEVAAEFVNAYRNGSERVLYIPDSDPAEQHYVTRSAVIWAATGPDVVVEPTAGAAEDLVTADKGGKG